MSEQREVVVLSGVRTAIGNYGGGLKDQPPSELAATVVREAFGTIRDDEAGFDILLGGGVATNGVNCAMLSLSVATGELVTTGSAAAENWRATGIVNGRVTTGYAGGCLWAENVGTPAEPDVRAVVIGAAVEFSTGYTGTR